MKKTDLIPINAADSMPRLQCPICGRDHVHPIAVECLSPGNRKGRVVINRDGLSVDPQADPDGRGTQITLRFCCEDGHSFSYSLHFHKGWTLVGRQLGPSMRADEGRTIWRD